jgi:hypothetical protein
LALLYADCLDRTKPNGDADEKIIIDPENKGVSKFYLENKVLSGLHIENKGFN